MPKKSGNKEEERLIRIAIVSEDRCKPKKWYESRAPSRPVGLLLLRGGCQRGGFLGCPIQSLSVAFVACLLPTVVRSAKRAAQW
eukprot:scaffold2377_cov376-Prasinococcus_capsulatus_cf.AAC.7